MNCPRRCLARSLRVHSNGGLLRNVCAGQAQCRLLPAKGECSVWQPRPELKTRSLRQLSSEFVKRTWCVLTLRLGTSNLPENHGLQIARGPERLRTSLETGGRLAP